jgi:hypothetical protein
MFNRPAAPSVPNAVQRDQSLMTCRSANVILALAMAVAVVIAASDISVKSVATGLLTGPSPEGMIGLH